MKQKRTEEDTRETLRELDQGEGISCTIKDGEKVSYFFTNKLPPFEWKYGKIGVELSSIEEDDIQLLYYLLGKTRGGENDAEKN